MARLTIRVPDDVAAAVRAAAKHEGCSVNAWVAGVLAGAVDRAPSAIELAGLVMDVRPPAGPAPAPAALARARRAAGRGRPLSEYVLDGRR